MLEPEHFINIIAGLVESIPLHKGLSERGLSFAWATFPPAAKQDLSANHLAYAATQRLLDPDPLQKLAIHVQLLTYLYPLRNGIPSVEAGLREDLEERMQSPHTFHPLSQDKAHQAPALPPPVTLPPFWSRETIQQRRQRLERIAAATGVKP